MIIRSTVRRVGTAALLATALLICPPAASGGILWDAGIACGYAAIVLLLCLYIYPVRPDGLPHARLFGLSQHRLLGWALLALCALHVGVLLGVEPLSTRYLLPSAPLYMWSGLVALLSAVLLIQTGLRARAALRRHQSLRLSNLHLLVSPVLVLTVGIHVCGSGQLSAGWLKTAIVLLLLALPLSWFALRPRTGPGVRQGGRRTTHLAAVAGLLLLPLPLATHALLEPAARPAKITVNFPHERHTSVSCITCHHNYLDKSGTTACIECHRSQRSDLPHSSEATFHSFCRDCHARLAAEHTHHGPPRSCSACHDASRPAAG
ncbi:MAG: cytochrome c3 family protein [Sinobacteraceae bacterium]|nr:cytochrome c3 family protein [Nevskiaceae bacterium]